MLPSIFQEQIEAEADDMERMLGIGADSFPEALTYFPAAHDYRVGSARYLDLLRRARDAVDIPVIASLNGSARRVGSSMRASWRKPARARSS